MTDSIYDQLNAYGTIAKQRFVENFSGTALDTDRWSQNNITGTGVFAMKDEADGGFELQSGSTSASFSSINFNTKKQYSELGSVFISVFKRTTTVSGEIRCGLESNTAEIPTDLSRIAEASYNSFVVLNTRDGTTLSSTNSTVSASLNYHVYKIENTSTNNKLTIDGSLEVTKTTNRPTTRLMPMIGSRYDSTSSTKCQIIYMEAYNT